METEKHMVALIGSSDTMVIVQSLLLILFEIAQPYLIFAYIIGLYDLYT